MKTKLAEYLNKCAGEIKAEQAQHTPGPWRTGDLWGTIFGPPNGEPCPEIIASINKRNRKANARLIAAAPELLETCKDIASCIDKDGRVFIPANGSTMTMLRVAIAKAEGR